MNIPEWILLLTIIIYNSISNFRIQRINKKAHSIFMDILKGAIAQKFTKEMEQTITNSDSVIQLK